MAPSEFSRSPQPSGRRRPLGALIIVVVLCLMAFLLGIFVGKHREVVSESVVAPSSIPHFTAASPIVADGAIVSVAPVVHVEVKKNEKPNSVPAQNDQQLADPIKQLISTVEQSPLGSGMNQAPVLMQESVASDAPIVLKVKPKVIVSVPAATIAVASDASIAKFKPQPVSKTGTYWVQVGSFKQRNDAEKVQKKLQSNCSAVVKRADLGTKGVWFRVLVGPVVTKDDAARLKNKLHDQYKMSGFVKKIAI